MASIVMRSSGHHEWSDSPVAGIRIVLGMLLFLSGSARADFPVYASNPFSFSIPEKVHGDPTLGSKGDQFFAVDLDGDRLPDFTFRSGTRLYAYAHDGRFMWSHPIRNPGGNGGAKHAAADTDGDGRMEIVALDSAGVLVILDGAGGIPEKYIPIGNLSAGQRAGHVMIANLRGRGDRDAIVQTIDVTPEGSGFRYYLNRSLIAVNLETGGELWRVEQDNTLKNWIYEGYWGQAHGPAVAADVDLDGMDEVLGANMIDQDGRIVNLHYPVDWVDLGTSYVDHLDAVSIGDFRPDLPGLEWIILEEDNTGYETYFTALLSAQGILWRKKPESLKQDPSFFRGNLLGDQCFEAQNAAVGNFDPYRPHAEFYFSSRFNGDNGFSQHPWILDHAGDLAAHYSTRAVLPAGFNPHPSGGNGEGLEYVWTIDWDGSGRDHITGMTRHYKGNAGVFDPMTGAPLWLTGREFPAVRSLWIYAADVAGDSREELILCDSTDTGPVLRIYWNENPFSGLYRVHKWKDPLYRRIKQNWNYYSPGNYTQRECLSLRLKVFLEGPYDEESHAMRPGLAESDLLPHQSPYSQAPATVASFPEGTLDWILIELKDPDKGETVYAGSHLLRGDGVVLGDTDNPETIVMPVLNGSYWILIHHRNHLPLCSAAPVSFASSGTVEYDFTGGPDAGFPDAAVRLPDGKYCTRAGDCNQDGMVTLGDYGKIYRALGTVGYRDSDIDMDGVVSDPDLGAVLRNRNADAKIPE
ncbi:VCBS repeat-containing protein [bacterium]|nr:VCBS repeat-containing protein [bacterium]